MVDPVSYFTKRFVEQLPDTELLDVRTKRVKHRSSI